MNALVLGGTGFIGRQVVAGLLERGHRVVIGSRHPDRSRFKLPAPARHCEMRSARHERLQTPQAWAPLLQGIDVAINCVGILRQRGMFQRETYERIHHLAPAALAAACAPCGVARLIHVSALGLHADARSGFITSKLRGEAALAAAAARAGGDISIVRPSLLDGPGGFGAYWLRRVARWPLHLVPASATGRIAPLAVSDLGEAIARLAELRGRADLREVELGGTATYSMRELIDALRRAYGLAPARAFDVPHGLARAACHALDVLHLTPLSFGHLELMARDNEPRVNRLRELLGREPKALGADIAQTADAALARG
jgi:NADH dehydrogenase